MTTVGDDPAAGPGGPADGAAGAATGGPVQGGPTTSGAAPSGGAGAVPPAMRAAASWSWRLLLVGAVLAVVLWLLSVLKVVVVPVAVALLLTVLLGPVTGWLHRRARLPRAAAAGATVVGMIVLVGGLLTLAGRSVVRGFGELGEQATEGVATVTDWLETGPLQLSSADLSGYLEQVQDSLAGSSSALVTGALHATTTVGHVLAGALIALFCTFFFLLDGRTIWTWVVGLLPLSARERVHQAGRRGVVTLGAYTRTQILVAAVDAVGIGLGAAVLRVPLALPLAVLVFLGSFVPIVGAVVTGAVAVLVALVAQGPGAAVIMLVVVLAVQQIEGHVLQPFLMGHAVSLHPVAVLLAVATGSFVAGIVGALFAVPLAAVLNTVLLYLRGYDKFPELGTEDHVAVRRPPVLQQAIAQLRETGTAQLRETGTAQLRETGTAQLRETGTAQDGGPGRREP